MNLFSEKKKIQVEGSTAKLANQKQKLLDLLSVYSDISKLTNTKEALESIFKGIDNSLGYRSSLLVPSKDMKSLEAFNINALTKNLISNLTKGKSFSVEIADTPQTGLAVKSFINGEIYRTDSMHEVVKPLVKKELANTVQKIIRIKHGMVLPVMHNDQVLAVITVGSGKPISEFDEKLLSGYSDLAGTIIYNSSLYSKVQYQVQRLTKQNEDLDALSQLAQNINEATTLKDLAQKTVDSLAMHSLFGGGVILTTGQDVKNLKLEAISKLKFIDISKLEKLSGSIDQIRIPIGEVKKKNPKLQRLIENLEPYASSDSLEALYPFLSKRVLKLAKAISSRDEEKSDFLVYPIRFRGKFRGIIYLFLNTSKYEDLSQNDKRVVTTFSNQIEVAVQKTLLLKETDATNRDLSSLYNLTSRIGGSLDTTVVAENAVDAIPQDEVTALVTIAMYNKVTGDVVTVALSKNRIQDALKKASRDLSDFVYNINDEGNALSPVTIALQENRPAATNDLAELFSPSIPKRFIKTFLSVSKARSAIIYPIRVREEAIGIISYFLSIDDIDLLTENQKKQFDAYGAQVAIALENAKLFEQTQAQLEDLQQQNRDLDAVAKLIQSINETLNLKDVAQNTVDSIGKHNKMSGGAVLILDDKREYLNAIAVSNTEELNIPMIQKVLGGDFVERVKVPYEKIKKENSRLRDLFEEGKRFVTDDFVEAYYPYLPKTVLRVLQRIPKYKDLIGVPIWFNNKVKAVLYVYTSEQRYSELDDWDKQLIDTFINQFQIAMENAFLLDGLKKSTTSLRDAVIQLKEANRKEKDMIDIIAHELRTPAGTAKSALILLESSMEKLLREAATADIEKSRKYINMALSNVRRLSNIITMMLSATRLDNDRLDINYEEVQVTEIIQSTVESFSEAAEKKNLKFVLLDVDEKLVLETDRSAIQQVIDNIVSNAIKYTDKGKITISIEDQKEEIVFHVEDTGIGIPEKELENIGKKFYRLQNYIYESLEEEDLRLLRPDGTGIGLYVVNGLLQALGGTLNVKSKVGKGSTFSVAIPKHKTLAMKRREKNREQSKGLEMDRGVGEKALETLGYTGSEADVTSVREVSDGSGGVYGQGDSASDILKKLENKDTKKSTGDIKTSEMKKKSSGKEKIKLVTKL